jgi:galactokinase
MFQSHGSSTRHFKNSTSFLDALVEIAATIDGVFGARVTCGDFGGVTVWFVEKDKTQKILTLVSKAYRQRTGAICTGLIMKASRGAHLL